MSVEVVTETDQDLSNLNLQRLTELAAFVLERQYVHPDTEGAISFVSEAEMERLHMEWMQLPGATDVMSFPMDLLTPGTPDNLQSPGMLGDVVVCLPVAATQAQAADHSLQTEVELLITHSLLHLLGFDHDTPTAEAEMFALQRLLLTEFTAARHRNTQSKEA